MVVIPEFRLEPGAGIGPGEVGGPGRDAKHRRSLRDRHAGEVPEPDQLGRSGVDIRQLPEHLVEGEQVAGVFVGFLSGNEIEVERHAGSASSVLDSTLATGVLDQNPPHRLGGDGEEVAAAVPRLANLGPDDAQIRFVNQHRGLERLPRTLPSQSLCGEPSQFVVDQREQVVGRLLFAATECIQDSSDFDGVGLDGGCPLLVIAG